MVINAALSSTNATPTPLDPSSASSFAVIKLWEAESLPSLTALAVLHLQHNQLFHHHNSQALFYLVLIQVSYNATSWSSALGILSLAGAECHSSIGNLTFQVPDDRNSCQQRAMVQHIWGQELEWRSHVAAHKNKHLLKIIWI